MFMDKDQDVTVHRVVVVEIAQQV